MKPGVHMIPAFDANYFEPGTMVTTWLVNEDGELRRGRIALVCGYDNGLQKMQLNEPWMTNECRPYEVSIDDYLSGRVIIKRMVEEEDSEDDTAEWIDKEVRGSMTNVCSKCGGTSVYPDKYCGNCGRSMKNGY